MKLKGNRYYLKVVKFTSHEKFIPI